MLNMLVHCVRSILSNTIVNQTKEIKAKHYIVRDIFIQILLYIIPKMRVSFHLKPLIFRCMVPLKHEIGII